MALDLSTIHTGNIMTDLKDLISGINSACIINHEAIKENVISSIKNLSKSNPEESLLYANVLLKSNIQKAQSDYSLIVEIFKDHASFDDFIKLITELDYKNLYNVKDTSIVLDRMLSITDDNEFFVCAIKSFPYFTADDQTELIRFAVDNFFVNFLQNILDISLNSNQNPAPIFFGKYLHDGKLDLDDEGLIFLQKLSICFDKMLANDTLTQQFSVSEKTREFTRIVENLCGKSILSPKFQMNYYDAYSDLQYMRIRHYSPN